MQTLDEGFIRELQKSFLQLKDAVSVLALTLDGTPPELLELSQLVVAYEAKILSIELPPEYRYSITQTTDKTGWRIMQHDGERWTFFNDVIHPTAAEAAGALPGAPPVETPPAWVQPLGAHDSYSVGAIVSHNGKIWISTVANNTWEPGIFGWTEHNL